MTAVDQAIAEINERLATFAPQHEGLRDFARLNLQEAAAAVVNESIANYDRRQALLEAALAALTSLVNDGHPDLPVREISPAAFADLRDNTTTVEAAMATFASNAATSMALAAGAVAPK